MACILHGLNPHEAHPIEKQEVPTKQTQTIINQLFSNPISSSLITKLSSVLNIFSLVYIISLLEEINQPQKG